MTLLKTSVLNGIAVAVRMATSLLLNKMLAVYVGPAGYALLGQFQNIVAIFTTFVTGGMSNGITKYTAEHHDDARHQLTLWQNAAMITLAGSVIAAAILIPFRERLAAQLLQDPGLSGVFVWLALSLVFLGLNALLMAILNGKKDVRLYMAANISGSLLSLAITGLLVWQLRLYGALIALCINQSVIFFLTVYLCRKTGWLRRTIFWGQWRLAAVKDLGQYALMGGVTAIVTPLAVILIRNHIRAKFGADYAGCWEAVWRISTLYLSLVTTTLSLYYLPRISEIRTMPELRREIWHVFRIVVPATAALSLTMYLARGLIVRLLFTSQFAAMEQLFAFQMMGDVVKIASWLLGFVMIGRAMIFWFVATEITASLLYWLLTLLFTPYFGFAGAALAYLVNYALYLVMTYFIVFHLGKDRMA